MPAQTDDDGPRTANLKLTFTRDSDDAVIVQVRMTFALDA